MIDALEPGCKYVLAEHTNEAMRIELCDGLVFKHLRSHDSFRNTTAEQRVRQLRLRAEESRRWPELNPQTFDEEANCVISPYLRGRVATRAELFALREHLHATGRGYIEDIGRNNVIMVDEGAVLIDFAVNENHPDFPGRERVSNPVP